MTDFNDFQHRPLIDDPEGDGPNYRPFKQYDYQQGVEDYVTIYDGALADAETFLTDLQAEYQAGLVDPSSLLTGRELLREQGYIDDDGNLTDEYLDANRDERLTAESIASGMGVPDDADFQVRVNHADLDEPIDGKLFIKFEEDQPHVLEVGTLETHVFEYATFAHFDDEDEPVIRTFESDDGPIEIEEIYGLEEGESINYTQYEGNPGDDEIDLDRIEDQQEILEQQAELLDEIEDALDGGGGGWDWEEELPGWDDLTDRQKAIMLITGGVLIYGFTN